MERYLNEPMIEISYWRGDYRGAARAGDKAVMESRTFVGGDDKVSLVRSPIRHPVTRKVERLRHPYD